MGSATQQPGLIQRVSDTGSQFTGTAINPARALGPAIVFHCHWNEVWLYIIAGQLNSFCVLVIAQSHSPKQPGTAVPLSGCCP